MMLASFLINVAHYQFIADLIQDWCSYVEPSNTFAYV